MGWEIWMPSVSVTIVWKFSVFSCWLFKIMRRVLFAVWIILSHIPPKCGASSGFIFQSMFCCDNCWAIEELSMLILSKFMTFFNAVKFSEINISVYPLLDTKRLIARKQLSLSRDSFLDVILELIYLFSNKFVLNYCAKTVLKRKFKLVILMVRVIVLCHRFTNSNWWLSGQRLKQKREKMNMCALLLAENSRRRKYTTNQSVTSNFKKCCPIFHTDNRHQSQSDSYCLKLHLLRIWRKIEQN